MATPQEKNKEYETRLKMRSVPMFPMKTSDRPKSADARCTVSSHSVYHKPGGGNKKIPIYITPDYKNTVKSKIGSKPVDHYQSSSHKVKIARNDVRWFRCVEPKVDDKDPAPWLHSSSRSIEELVEAEGFVANPRFSYETVKSNSFGSISELLNNCQ